MCLFISRKLRQKIPAKILICLCTSLLLLLVVFVVGVKQTEQAHICHIVAGMLHYFTLTTFAWMLVEAVNLYRTIVKVFTTGNESRFFKWMFVYAWGKKFSSMNISFFKNVIRQKLYYFTQSHQSICKSLIRSVSI